MGKILLAAMLVFCVTANLSYADGEAAKDIAKPLIVLPVDEAARDPDFFVFRRNLIKALIERNDVFIKSVISPDIKYSFGGGDGITGFYQEWRLGKSDSPFYATLLDVLLNGGAMLDSVQEGQMEDRYCAPYTFTAENIPDPFETVIVMDKGVPVYNKPSEKGKIIYRASYNALKVSSNDKGEEIEGWQEVQTPAGKSGYVKKIFIRSPIDYRACFVKKDGAYKMEAFVAGD